MPGQSKRQLAVFVYGAGKVGCALARGLRAKGVKTRLRAARHGLPHAFAASVVVLAVREGDLTALARALARGRLVPPTAVVLHVSGVIGVDALAPLRGICAGVGQMHPMISFASTRFSPGLARGSVHVQGDPVAVTQARRIARLLGMKPRTFQRLDAVAYHAAAGLVANGSAALTAMGAELLERAGIPSQVTPKMLGPLLRSVADNVERLGLPEALTGPVRRGDAAGIAKHLAVLRDRLPQAVGLYLAAVEAQVPLACALGDAPAESFAAIARLIDEAKTHGMS